MVTPFFIGCGKKCVNGNNRLYFGILFNHQNVHFVRILVTLCRR